MSYVARSCLHSRITELYGREEALKVIRAGHADYRAKYPELSSLWLKDL